MQLLVTLCAWKLLVLCKGLIVLSLYKMDDLTDYAENIL